MGNNDFDFRIDQPALVQTLEVYREMEKLLEEEQDRQLGDMADLMKEWKGFTAEGIAEGFKSFYETGKYNKAYSKVRDMRICLEESLPEINALLERCEGFIDELKSDEYVEPIRSADGDNTVRNGGVLSINYNKVAWAKDACENIIKENKQLTGELADIISGCSDIIDGTDSDLEALKAASKKINRVENYADSLQIYENGIKALENDMLLKLNSITEDLEELRNEYEAPQKEHKKEISIIPEVYSPDMSKKELEAFIKRMKLSCDIDSMLLTADQIFARDAEEWNDADAYFIARMWDYAFETGNVQVIEAYIEDMLVSGKAGEQDKRVNGREGYSVWEYGYQVNADSQKIQLIMEQLDPREQGEAYYTLNRISKNTFQTITIKGTELDLTPKNGAYNVDVSFDDNGKMKINIVVGTQCGQDSSIAIADQFEMTVYDLKENNGLKLINMGFDTDEIEAMRMNAITDADISFMGSLFELDYDAAFLNDPSNFSEEWKLSMTQSANKIVSSEKYAENFINGLLHTYPERCIALGNDTVDAYLEILSSRSKLIIDSEVGMCMPILNEDTDKAVLQELEKEWKKQYRIYGVWSVLLEATQSRYFHNLDNNYMYGLYTYKIEITNSKNSVPFMMNLGVYDQHDEVTYHFNKSYPSVEQKNFITVDIGWGKNETITDLTEAEWQELCYDMELEKTEALFDLSTLFISKIPMAKETMDFLKGFYKGDVKGVTSITGKSADELLVKAGEVSDLPRDTLDYLGANGVASIISKGASSILGYHQIMEKYRKKLSKAEKKYIDTTMGSCVAGHISDDVTIVDSGIYDPHTIAKLNTWSEKGLAGLISGEDISNKVNDIADEIGYKEDSKNHYRFLDRYTEQNGSEKIDMEELTKCLNVMLYGSDFDGNGSIDCEQKLYEMSPIVLINAIDYIDTNIYILFQDENGKVTEEHSCLDYLSME